MDDCNSKNSIANSYHGKNFLKRMNNHDRHAELFRKDLISAMKMPDSETLQPDDYLEIVDPWKLEWERGVQVPVNVNALTPMFRTISNPPDLNDQETFTLPKRLLYSGSILDDSFKSLVHELYDLQKQVASICRYDLDELDSAWLKIFNQSQEKMGDSPLEESDMEKVIEDLEVQCHSKMKEAVRTIEGLGIEYDENVVCDICRSPEGEESNEMVFCDNCDICVHQACYGIQNIPEGSWLCRTCALGIKPKCVLCPMIGGAMKSTKNGDKWAHISCALWVPEVSIGCPEKMEPITNISQIPTSRWALVCTLCRERSGACIQCSIRSCKTSFHVTCAFKYKLNLSTVIDDETEDVQMKAYCPKHSGLEGSNSQAGVGGVARSAGGSAPGDFANEEEEEAAPEPLDRIQDGVGSDRKSKRNKDGLTEEQRSQRLKRLAEDFYTFADTYETSQNLGLPLDVVDAIHAYWTLKRKSRCDVALMTIKEEDEEGSSPRQGEEMLKERMKMFIQLRQDLERVRNLCYMVNKREKMKRHERRMKEEIFSRQVSLYSRFLDEQDSDEDSDAIDNPCTMFSQHHPAKKFQLSDSDEEEEFSRSYLQERNHDSSISTAKSFTSTYLKAMDSGDDDYNFKSNQREEEDFSSIIINNNNNSSFKSNFKRDSKTKKINSRTEEKNFLMTAHKSTGTIYDMPSYALSCSFKDNHFLNNDRSFMKSAVSAAVGKSVMDDDDDDDDEIFPKSFKYDMKIDEDYYLENNYASSNSMMTGSVRGRGRPKKNKRGRPPRVVSRETIEEDDSDYYRRLSDEDFEEEIHKLASASKTLPKVSSQPPTPVPVPAEKKRRGRKRKSELEAGDSISNKHKISKEKAAKSANLPNKKRKYTKKKGIKAITPQTKRKQAGKESEEVKNVSSPSFMETSACDFILTVGAATGDVDETMELDGKQDSIVVIDMNPQSEMAESEDDIPTKDRGGGRFIPSSDEEEEDGIEEEVDPEVRARREKAAELLKDMEFSDSSTEEEEVDGKTANVNDAEVDDVIVYDVDSQDALESTTVGLTDEQLPVEQQQVQETDALPAESNPNATVASPSPCHLPLLLPPLLLRSPSPLFTSSDEEASDENDSKEADKNNSKVTGVIDKDSLNINSRHMLLHKLPIKDFIVSNQIKNMVQNFFSNLGAPGVPSTSRLAFNGFKLPQGKIEC